MAKTRIAVNGLGRIGRNFVRLAAARPELEIVAVNDLGELENLAYLLQYDTVYGKSAMSVKADAGAGELVLDGTRIKFIQEKDPAKLPWAELGIDVAVEATGLFEDFDTASAHLAAGAKRVVISAPSKGGSDGATVLVGVNEEKLGTCTISSNASCTTNAGSPVMAILDEALGIEKAVLNTVHAYTATQKIVDAPDARDYRRGRAGAANIVPSSTGAALALTEALESLKGKFDGIALRVPVIAGSIADITFVSSRPTTVEEVNEILERAANDERWKGIFSTTREQVVSSDIVGDTHASIADLAFTRVVGGDLVKVLAWYDNEMGYAHTLVEHVVKAGEHA